MTKGESSELDATLTERGGGSGGHAALLMSSLRSDGQVETKVVVDSIGHISNNINNNNNNGSNSSDSNNCDGSQRQQPFRRPARLFGGLAKPQQVLDTVSSRFSHNWKWRKRQQQQQPKLSTATDDADDGDNANGGQLDTLGAKLDAEVGQRRRRQRQSDAAAAAAAAGADLDEDKRLFSNLNEANAFYVYELSLRVGPFKRSVWLLGFIAFGLLLTMALIEFSSPLENQPPPPPIATYHWLIRLSPPIVCLIQLAVLAYIAIQIYLKFKVPEQTQQRDHFGMLQLAVLISGAAFATLIAIQRPQLIAIQPIIMFILYTLLSVNPGRVFIITLLANIVHLLAWLPYTCLVEIYSSSRANKFDTQTDAAAAVFADQSQFSECMMGQSESVVQLKRHIPIVFVSYAVFHAIGLYLNKQSLQKKQCQESFKIIKDYVTAKLDMDYEDKRLIKMLESAIPQHLVQDMRDDIMDPKSNGLFRKVCLRYYENVSILFADIVNFTKIAANLEAHELVVALNELFGRFDEAAQANKCLRIKILGDCYYCVSGIPDGTARHAVQAVEMGLDMIEILGKIASQDSGNSGGVNLNMRVGIHSGRVLCGVLGKTRWQFDVHSNDVRLANHCEQSGAAGRVHITEATLGALGGRYQVEPADGQSRDAYIAHRNMSTYFVIPSESRERQKLLASSGPKLIGGGGCGAIGIGGGAGADGPAKAANAAVVATSTAAMTVPDGLASASAAAATTGATARLSGANHNNHNDSNNADKDQAKQQQQQLELAPGERSQASVAARKRFILAAGKLITMLYLIDPPFSNLAPPTKVKTSRLLMITIERRRKERNVHPLTLDFKDKEISQLYKSPSRLSLRMLIFLVATLFVAYLACSTSRFAPPPPPADSRGANRSEAANVSPAPPPPNSRVQLEAAATDALSWDSWLLIGETLFVFLLSVLVYAHQTEYNSRRDFLWRQRASRDRDQVGKMRACNRSIFYNLLPTHVAQHFLEHKIPRDHMARPPAGEQQLYSKSYERIGVVFAAIANFGDFYSEVEGNAQGRECLRVLNEILCDFDSILEEARFGAVDKIKTIGSTYMAAIGLSPDSQLPARAGQQSPSQPERGHAGQTIGANGSQETHEAAAAAAVTTKQNNKDLNLAQGNNSSGSGKTMQQQQLNGRESESESSRAEVAKCLQTLVSFVFEMKAKLRDINDNSFNNFQLRAGINLGPVTAGVIGATKPQYDIWGNTVNVASRMESTAESNRIQITQEVYNILRDFNQETNFEFTCRGTIDVKGKGFMTTYYLEQQQQQQQQRGRE